MNLEDREEKLKELINIIDDMIPEEYSLQEDDLEALKSICIRPDRSAVDYEKALRTLFLWGWSRGVACTLNEIQKDRKLN